MGLGDFVSNGNENWLDRLEKKAEEKGHSIDRYPNDKRADFAIEDCLVGKIRETDSNNRSEPRIWLRFDKELEMVSDYPNLSVYSVVIDSHSDGPGFDPELDHFIPVTEKMLLEDTYGEEGDRDFDVLGKGKYESPFGDVADDWAVIFRSC